MRRAFLIFLALLFPLNVMALTLPAAASQPAAGVLHAAALVDAAAQIGTACADQAPCDADTNEPPPLADGIDTLCPDGHVPPVLRPVRSARALAPPWRGHDPLPPLKPPPAA